MPGFIKGYIRVVDAVNYRLGRVVMYGIFVMIAIFIWSIISKQFLLPSVWTLETAQFVMVAYYMLGGPYSIQMGANVRMDLFYHEWDDVKKAWFDAFTVLFLLFYLSVLLYGSLRSTAYSLGYFGSEYGVFYRDLIFGVAGEILQGNFGGLGDKIGELTGRFETSATAWRPYLWPIKFIMTLGITMMLLQALSEFFKDVARIRGEEI